MLHQQLYVAFGFTQWGRFLSINSWHAYMPQGFEQQVLSKWLTRKFIENSKNLFQDLSSLYINSCIKKNATTTFAKLLLTIENYIKCHEIAAEVS